MRALFAALFDSKRAARQDAAMQSISHFLARVALPVTPALVIRRAAMLTNLAAMQAACDAKGVRLRAHGKMHKCSRLGLLQVEMGAVGLCCQTVGEVEAFVAGGITDVLVTAPVPAWGWRRLAALAGRVGAVIDSAAQAHAASAAAAAAGVTLDAYVDVDPGMGRAGVAPAEAPVLARLLTTLPGLNYAGVQAYCGHHQHLLPAERTAAHADWTSRLAALLATLRAEGLAPAQVTGSGRRPLHRAAGRQLRGDGRGIWRSW